MIVDHENISVSLSQTVNLIGCKCSRLTRKQENEFVHIGYNTYEVKPKVFMYLTHCNV